MTGKILTAATIAMALTISVPSTWAQRHNGAQQSSQKTERTQNSGNTTRPGRSQRGSATNNGRNQQPSAQVQSNKQPQTQPAQRPGNNNQNQQQATPPKNNNNNYRPAQSTTRPSQSATRPGFNNFRPGQNNGAFNFGGNNGNNPGNNNPPTRPPYNISHNRPAANPQPAQRPAVLAPPARPHRLPFTGWHRPTRPAVWRPWTGPSLAGILGITFGTAIAASLDYLYNNNYFVDGYGNDVVYLRNVSEMNYIWPDATLYYGSAGLVGSQFSYSTTYSDMSRYNNLYMQLVGRYGQPAEYTSNAGALSATWFGPDNGFIRLQFDAINPGTGTRFYTTLEFGN